MLTGSLPFQGENRKATMTMILKWVSLQLEANDMHQFNRNNRYIEYVGGSIMYII